MSASLQVKVGSEGRTPELAIDGKAVTMTHSQYRDGLYAKEDHWARFIMEDQRQPVSRPKT